MSDIPVNPEPIASGEGIAERYIDKELIESRASLKRTQIIGSVLTVLIVGYLGYLTSGFRSNLEPHAAAEIATGLASQRIDEVEPQFASYIREEVPKAIRRAPDEVIARLPEYRANLEEKAVDTLRIRSEEATKRLNTELMAFLTEHKENVGALLKDADDPAAVEEMGKGLEAQFRTFLKEEEVNGTSIQAKMDAALKTLTLVEKRTAHLAANKGLNPSEKKARHAVAMLMHRIDSAKATSGPLPTIDPAVAREAINTAASNIAEKVKTAANETLE